MATRYYSVVINNLPHAFEPEFLHPYVAFGDDGREHVRNDGYVMMDPYDKDKHGELQNHMVLTWKTPMNLYVTSPLR